MADQQEGVAPRAEQSASAASAAPAAPVEQDDKFFASLGYFGPLFVVPLIVKPKSAYCKFHAKQSMVLFLIFVVFLFILGFISAFLGSLLTLPLFAIYVIAIYRAYQGDMWNIPIVSKFAGKMNVDELYGKAGLAVSTIAGLKEKAQGFASQAGETVKSLGQQEEKAPPEAPGVQPAQTPGQHEPPTSPLPPPPPQ